MKAVLVTDYIGPKGLKLGDVESPALAPDGVRVAVHAAGLNFYDILMVRGMYQAKPPTPFVLGTEAAGEVVEAGTEVVGRKPGDRVLVASSTGAFAEELVAPEADTFALPDGVDFTTAAALRAVYGTSRHALRDRANLKPGETLLVHGAAGGVGLAAVELGRLTGARVIGTVGSDAKAEVVRRYGADEVINYTTENLRDRVKELTGGIGADVVYDPVGGDVFDQSLRCINWGGRLLVIGFASGRIPEAPANLVLLKGCSVVGVFYGAWSAREPAASRALTEELIEMCAEGRIRPHVSATFPLAGVREAMAALIGRSSTGKLVLTAR